MREMSIFTQSKVSATHFSLIRNRHCREIQDSVTGMGRAQYEQSGEPLALWMVAGFLDRIFSRYDM